MENIMSSIVTGIVSSLLVTYILGVKDKNKAKRILLENMRFMESIEENFLFIHASLAYYQLFARGKKT